MPDVEIQGVLRGIEVGGHYSENIGSYHLLKIQGKLIFAIVLGFYGLRLWGGHSMCYKIAPVFF